MNMSDEQEAILQDPSKHICVIAGPGSGKTRLIVEKVLRLLKDRKVNPQSILIITYTKKATQEIKDRIRLATKRRGVQVFTLHSFCLNAMRKFPLAFPKRAKRKILDPTGQQMLLGYRWRSIAFPRAYSFTPKKQQNLIQRIKTNYTDKELDINNPPFTPVHQELIQAIRNYNEILDEQEFMDFADIINMFVAVLETDEQLRKDLKKRYKYVLVDEYQDVNRNQERLVKLLCGEETHMMIVGDPNQSIFGFQGGNPELIRQASELNDMKTHSLTDNYRSTKSIITVSNAYAASFNRARSRPVPGSEAGYPVSVIRYDHAGLEAQDIAEYIAYLKDIGQIKHYDEAAILFRSIKSDTCKEIIKALHGKGIAAAVYSDEEIRSRQPLKGILELFNILARHHSDTELTYPEWGCTLRIRSLPLHKGPIGLSQELMRIYLNRAPKDQLVQALRDYEHLRQFLAQYTTVFPSKDPTKYLAYVPEQFEEIELSPGEQEFEDAVQLMTLHKAKGLEFPVVILANVTKDAYFHKVTMHDTLFPDHDGYKELLRTFYVGITRAEKQVIITHCGKPVEPATHVLSTPGTLFGFPPVEQVNRAIPRRELHPWPVKQPKRGSLTELSYSMIKDYTECPFKFYWRYVLKSMPNLDDFSVQKGRMLHEIMRIVNHYLKQGTAIDIQLLDAIIQELWPGGSDPILRQKLLSYLDICKENSFEILEIEQEFEHVQKNLVLQGRIDLLVKTPRGHILIDFKSGSHSPENEVEGKRQISTYAAAFQEYAPLRGMLIFFGGKNLKIINYPLTSKDLPATIVQAAEKIRAAQFEPRLSGCMACARSHDCPKAHTAGRPVQGTATRKACQVARWTEDQANEEEV